MKFQVVRNIFIYKMRSFLKRLFNNKKIKILPKDFLSKIFSLEKAKGIFVHAGLSKIRFIEGVSNPYAYLLTELEKNYKVIFVPGFTPSFRNSGIFHKKYSKPEYGMWSKLFLKDSEQRTMDAIHSIQVKGDYDFSSCDHQDSFGSNSCFNKLIKDNILVADIGTDDFVCTFIHVVECLNKVPYIYLSEVDGVVYSDDNFFYNVKQLNYEPKIAYRWNRNKLVRELKNNGLLRDYSSNGFLVYFFYAGDVFKFLDKKVKENSWYLVI
ncbi:AAC(3) family N-acetyltransferase [Treponema sp.]|uniref:AAC(3) family N-acetyltransferase n=1 Tax=Treponema sp. TaxID=166 RepID=UPI003890F40C